MRKIVVRFIVDFLLFTDVCAMAAVGLLLAVAVPDGRAVRGARDFLGLHRHAWRDIHLFLSIGLLVLLAVHLWFNWPWITGTAKRYFGRRWKQMLWCAAFAWAAVVLVAWITAA